MSTAVSQKTIPLISSGTAGPLGAVHLPRLWAKLTLGSADRLADGYDFCGAGFDQMTIDALGLKREAVIAFVRDKKPTYMQFEEYVLQQNGGSLTRDKIEAHNAAIKGYNHSAELGAEMRKASGVSNASVGDAVTLNTLEDLDGLHAQVTGA
ncbi:MAG: DUF5069 domain-containing protein [Vulcanimicrobiaceae bacterium]